MRRGEDEYGLKELTAASTGRSYSTPLELPKGLRFELRSQTNRFRSMLTESAGERRSRAERHALRWSRRVTLAFRNPA